LIGALLVQKSEDALRLAVAAGDHLLESQQPQGSWLSGRDTKGLLGFPMEQLVMQRLSLACMPQRVRSVFARALKRLWLTSAVSFRPIMAIGLTFVIHQRLLMLSPRSWWRGAMAHQVSLLVGPVFGALIFGINSVRRKSGSPFKPRWLNLSQEWIISVAVVSA
jgi:hypothetical protein